MRNDRKSRRQRQRHRPIVLLLWIAVGIYLLYTAYSLLGLVIYGQGALRYVLGAFMAFFAIFGILMVVFPIIDFIRGNYVGGSLDRKEKESRREGG